MAIYINNKTNATLVTDDVISGGDWELFEPKKQDDTPTVEELKQLLKELGVDFDLKAKKAELLELYEANKAE